MMGRQGTLKCKFYKLLFVVSSSKKKRRRWRTKLTVLSAIVTANNRSRSSYTTNLKSVSASSACRLGDGERNKIQPIYAW
jgi:hypothetical protein